jgi:ABC-type multidrug transport system ATPase subunit
MARIFSGSIERTPGLRLCHQWQRPESPPELALLGAELFALLGADPATAPEVVRPLLSRPLYRLSGGQFQMLHTLACWCSPAQLVLMDEPTNNLDGRALEALSGLLHGMDPSRAVLLVSHEHAFLERHCTQLVEVGS